MEKPAVIHGFSLITEHDTYLFKEGNHFRLYEKMGSHIVNVDGVSGTFFAVWAPNAEKVSVIGDFNFWDRDSPSSGGKMGRLGYLGGIHSGTRPWRHIQIPHRLQGKRIQCR